MYWITMKDTFMSGWGKAEGLTNIFRVTCDTFAQANAILDAANARGEMKYVIFRSDKSYYPPSRYIVSDKHFDDLGGIWKETYEEPTYS